MDENNFNTLTPSSEPHAPSDSANDGATYETAKRNEMNVFALGVLQT